MKRPSRGRARVGDHDPVERALLGAGAGEANFQGHSGSSFLDYAASRRLLRFIVPRISGRAGSFLLAGQAGQSREGRRGRAAARRRGPAGRRASRRRAAPAYRRGGRRTSARRSSAAGSICGMPPPMPIMPPSLPNMPLPLPMAFIMSAIWRCIFRSLLISSTRVPEPAATRFLRLALRTSGFLRSAASSRR